MQQRLTVRDFHGDWKTLSRLLKASWGENQEGGLEYSPEFLSSCFDYPGASRSLSPTIYSGDDPVAFITGFPRYFKWNGQASKMVLSSLLTSAPEAKRKGYGAWLWIHLAKRARTAGYDGMISLCVDGGEVNRLVEASGHILKFPTAKIFTVGYMTRMLGHAQTQPALCTREDVALFLELASSVTVNAPFHRVWSEAEARWQCCERYGALTAVHRGPERRGMLTGYVVEALGGSSTRFIIIEDLFWHELSPEERIQLLTNMMTQGASCGARMASVPVMGYCAIETLQALRFRPSLRRMNVYVTQWSGPPPEPVDSVYLDIL